MLTARPALTTINCLEAEMFHYCTYNRRSMHPGRQARQQTDPELGAESTAPPRAPASLSEEDKSCRVGQAGTKLQESANGRQHGGRAKSLRWINDHFTSSPAGVCAHCGDGERADDPFVLLSVGTDRGEVHSSCHPTWLAEREAEACSALGIYR